MSILRYGLADTERPNGLPLETLQATLPSYLNTMDNVS